MQGRELDVTDRWDEFSQAMVVCVLLPSRCEHAPIAAGLASNWKRVAMSRTRVLRTRAEKSRML